MSRRVVLRSERTRDDTRHLEAYLDTDGALHIDGQDLGPGTAPFSDDGEYEWFRTIPAAEVPRLVELLGGDEGEALREAGLEFLRAEDVRNPDALVALYAP